MTEQLWAMLKPLSKKVRYMSRANWQDTLDNALLFLSEKKQWEFAELLRSKLQATAKKLGEWGLPFAGYHALPRPKLPGGVLRDLAANASVGSTAHCMHYLSPCPRPCRGVHRLAGGGGARGGGA